MLCDQSKTNQKITGKENLHEPMDSLNDSIASNFIAKSFV